MSLHVDIDRGICKRAVDEIIVSGGSTLIGGIVSSLEERSGITVRVAEPFKNVDVPDMFDKEYVKKVEPLVTVAVGLALRRMGDK